MKIRPRIAVIGSLVFDFVAKAPRLPRSGETVLGDMFGMFPGGKGANQAVQAGRLGAEVYMIGRVGPDFLGDKLIDSLQESGVSTEFVRRDPAVKTAACCIHVDAQGSNSIIIVPEANMACAREDIDAARAVIASADVVLTQLEIALPAVEYAVGLAAECGVPVILNPAPAQPIPPAILANVTVLTPNETEAELLTRSPAATYDSPLTTHHSPLTGNEAWCAQIARQLHASGPRTVILTLGENGAYFFTKDAAFRIPAYQVRVVDTTAAGDAFNGALAVALGEGMKIEDAIAFANAAGALATTRVGAQPSLAPRAEVDVLFRSRINLPDPAH